MEENLPPGFRFHPTDEELITYYLMPKVSNISFISKAVAEVDLNKCEPWDLPAKASMGEKEWYFFSMRDRKYPTGLRTNRATEAGYWKTTGKDKEIFRAGRLVGMKKTLVFYRGRAPRGETSNWVMHEYRLGTKPSFKTIKDEWVVCRVFQKSSSLKITELQQHSPNSSDSVPDSPSSVPPELSDVTDFPANLINPNFIGGSNNHAVITNNIMSVENNNNNLSLLSNNGHNLTWSAASTQLPWPGSFLSPANLAVSSLILKAAMQIKNYIAPVNGPNYVQPQQDNNISNLLANSRFCIGSTDLPLSFYEPSSSSKQQQAGLEQQGPEQDQPFNWPGLFNGRI